MGVEYFLATDTEFYRKIAGPADNPTNPVNMQHPPGVLGGASGFFAAITLDGTIIWLGGDAWGAPQSSSSTLWRSINGGAAWTNEYLLHPDGGLAEPWDFFGFPSTGDLWLCGQGSGADKICKWTGSLWSAAAPGGFSYAGTSRRPNSLWGTSPTDMYCIAKTAGSEEVLKNDGTGWIAEAGSTLEAQLLADGGGSPIAITGAEGFLYVWCQVSDGSNMQVYKGVFGGPWARETRSWSNGGVKIETTGKCIMADETGAIWLFMTETGGYEVHRRDPTSGLWAMDHQFIGTTGNEGGIFVVNSSNILISSNIEISMYDGTTWYDYATGSRWGWSDRARGIWGRMTSEISSVTGPDGTARISTKGGEVLSVVGLFPVGLPMTAHLGPAGDTTDPPCYFGFGLGYTGESSDGTTVQIIAPPLDKTSSAILTIVVDSETLTLGGISVVERSWPEALHNMRRNFSSWKALGRRRLDQEPLE